MNDLQDRKASGSHGSAVQDDFQVLQKTLPEIEPARLKGKKIYIYERKLLGPWHLCEI